MTDDVKQPPESGGESTPPTTPQGSEPTQSPPENKSEPQAKTESQPSAPQEGKEEERTVPLNVLIEERKRYRDRIRKMQRGQLSQRQSADAPSRTTPQGQQGQQIDPRYVQELQTRVAVSELQEFARQKVRDYPDLPKHLKRAIINNPRGFIKPNTGDVETGKLDIEDFLEDEQTRLEDEQLKSQPTTPKKEVKVAGGNKPDNIQPGATPADIQKILNTPLDEWTKEDQALLKEYKESHGK